MFRYPSNQISMSNAIHISMTTSQVSGHTCQNITDILSEYGA